MNKALLFCLLAFSTFTYSQDIAFNKLFGNGDPANYYLGHYPVTGSDGLNIKWYGGIRLSTSAGTAMQVYNTSVGIGTDNPKAKFDITFPGEPKSILFVDNPNNVNSMNARMRFTWYNDSADFGVIRTGDAYIEGMAINFNDSEKVRFSASGNIGLGIQSPQYKLSIGNGGDIALIASSTASTDAGDVIFQQSTGLGYV